MTRTRWIQYGGLLAVAFVLSVGAGALIGRQRTAPAASVPTPTPVLASAGPTTAPPMPTSATTPTPSIVPPTTPPTLPPTAPPLDPLTAEEFAMDLLAALQAGDTGYLFERLHPLDFERYGTRQCRRHVGGFAAEPDASWTVLSSSGPAPWEWETDGLTTTVDDTTTVVVSIPDTGERELHFAPFEGAWRWFTDCGEPR